MNKQAIFDFIVEKEARTITVERSFNAPLDTVWAAWTQADILCKWWAPKPYECVIASLDFREGGRWLYYMQGPGGDRHWCYFDYETIRPMSHFSGSDAFCDEHGVANNIKPKVSWEANFGDAGGSTLVSVVLHFASPEDLDQIIQMGFREGFTQGLQQLEELLASGTGGIPGQAQDDARPNYNTTTNTMRTLTRITVSALVNKPVEQVWNIWTDPKHITQWCAVSDDWHCPKASNDPRAGGKFSSTMAARDGSFSFDFEGVYDDVQDPGSRPGHARIAYTMADGRTCEILFSSEQGGTRVVESFDAETQNSVEMQRSGWQAILDRFKAHAEALS